MTRAVTDNMPLQAAAAKEIHCQQGMSFTAWTAAQGSPDPFGSDNLIVQSSNTKVMPQVMCLGGAANEWL